MIPKTKHGDCSNPDCNQKDTSCVKVGRNLYCLNCRKKQKTKEQISKAKSKVISRELHKTQVKSGNNFNAEKAFLIQDLDISFSQYVRKKEADKDGFTKCFTCGQSASWKMMDCGHFISRSNLFLRWDLRNLRPQCKTCNQYKQGELAMFAVNLEIEQPGVVMSLMEDSKTVCKWSREELKQMLISIRAKLQIVEIKFKK
jgi:hypothetical protein